MAAAAARAVLPIPASVCSVFTCANNGMAASVWISELHTEFAAGNCTTTWRLYDQCKRVSTKSWPWEKIACHVRELNLCQYCGLLFSPTLCWVILPPLHYCCCQSKQTTMGDGYGCYMAKSKWLTVVSQPRTGFIWLPKTSVCYSLPKVNEHLKMWEVNITVIAIMEWNRNKHYCCCHKGVKQSEK